MILENKQLYKSYLREFSYPNETNYENAVRNFFSEEASINVVHPINKIQGSENYIDKILKPMMKAFEGLYRRDYIVIGGNYEGNFVASGGWPSHGGHLCKEWLGIKPKGQQFTCRVSDWWRRDGDKLVENWVFVDLVDMLKQLGYDVFKAVNVKTTFEKN